jgi:inner membrane protease subunit 2
MAELAPEHTWTKFKRTWRSVLKTHPIINKSLSVLYWLPVAVVFTKYFYTVKVATGSSMQVQFLYRKLSQGGVIHLVTPASRHLTRTCLFRETSLSSTAFPHGGIVGSLGETSLHSGVIIFSTRLQLKPIYSRSPDNPKLFLVKRILALEGDVVKTLPPFPQPEICVPTGHAWVEGERLSDIARIIE